MSAAADVARWRANLKAERESIAIYRAMAAGERNPELATVYRELAETEARHAALWAEQLRLAGVPIPPPRVGWRASVLSLLAHRVDPGLVAPVMANNEARDRSVYDDQPETRDTPLPYDERSHARVLAVLASSGLGNALRAAVLGVNDGLVSNFSLVMGVAGAGADSRTILLAGTAGLLAGSLSMALGEWLSVQSARELYERKPTEEAEYLLTIPEGESQQLARVYRSRGMSDRRARELASIRAPEPDDAGGSALTAALTSFAMFA
ncbi:MAG: VIT1/CCC1 transporter family protein, partial [Deltaproteobacteria bacterium]|nr:VIT1/CCC1 transporter family protein [Deltaproteobacteria bacterium]